MERRDAILVEEGPKPARGKKRSRAGRGARHVTGAPATSRSITIVSPAGDLRAVEARLFGRS